MSDELNAAIIGGLVGAAAAGPISYVLNWFQRRREGKDRYLSAIADIYAKLGESNLDLFKFFEHSLPSFRSAIFGVQPYIPSVSYERLVKLLREYQVRGEQQSNWQHSTYQETISEMLSSKAAPPAQAPADIWIPDFLRRFRDEVK